MGGKEPSGSMCGDRSGEVGDCMYACGGGGTRSAHIQKLVSGHLDRGDLGERGPADGGGAKFKVEMEHWHHSGLATVFADQTKTNKDRQ